MSEYGYVEQPILTWLCGRPEAKYEARGLGWTYRDDEAMALYERPLEDPLVEKLLVAAIQRINTAGGLAPTTGCSASIDVGKKALIPYTADYYFYKYSDE